MAWHHLAIPLHHIDLRKQEQVSPEYLKINPNATVPCLQTPTKTIPNSTDILIYLNRHYVDQKHLNAAVTEQAIDFCRADEKIHDPHIRLLSYTKRFANPNTISAEQKAALLNLADHHPISARGQFLRTVVQGEVASTNINAAHAAILARLQYIEQQLQQYPFVFGNNYTMADSAATAFLYRLEKLGLLNENLEKLNKPQVIQDYYQRMKADKHFRLADMI